MRLSILIPEYNYDCTELVENLQKQAETCGVEYEILVADDSSDNEEILRRNTAISSIPNCSFHMLSPNRGRAFVRNWLMENANGEYLLYVDSDAVLCTPDFIRRYLDCIGRADVVCGGIVHPDELPSPRVSLRYYYEKGMEPRFTARRRNRNPYGNLRTFNYMIRRTTALQHSFDISIKRYGYEDTLVGMDFQKNRVSVLHIDNPLLNGDLEENQVFLAKTQDSLKCLHEIRHKIGSFSRLLVYYRILWLMLRMDILVAALFSRTSRRMERHLTSASRPSMLLFQFYKLAYYCRLAR